MKQECKIEIDSTGTWVVNYYTESKLYHSIPVSDYFRAKQLQEAFYTGDTTQTPKFLSESN